MLADGTSMDHPIRATAFVVSFLVPFSVQLVFASAWPDWGTIGTAGALFAVVVVAAGLCAITSAFVLWRGFVTKTPELSWLGLFFFAVSMLPFVHGVTTPGVLYGPNSATTVSVVLAIPIGIVAAAPTLLPRHGRLARAWRGWSITWIAAITALSVALLVAPNAVRAPNMRTPIGVLAIAACVAGCLALGWRQLRLARIAQRRAPLAVAAGYSFVAGSAAVLLGSEPLSVGFWLAHVFDIAGVLVATVAAAVVYQRSRSMVSVLAPVVAVEPIAALDVGMHPDVIDFVAELDTKDPMTRDHVVRTAELAIQVAALMRLPAESQRDAGLVGALHDIGKLQIPDEILTKPGALDDAERAVMQTHAALGGTILESSKALCSLAPVVRAHHERVDGGGYPDRLAGEDIPLLARIVSVCDAYDAMAYTRRYRSGMPLEQVTGILREHAGTQWDPLVVQAVITIVSNRRSYVPQLLASQRDTRCDCLPAELQALEVDALLSASA